MMIQTITTRLVNAFTNQKDHGNPAAVCIVDNFPNFIEMQKIATKNNLSETSFVKRKTNNDFDIRWFTPISEAPICVHATLASAHILYEDEIIPRNQGISFFNGKNKFTAHINSRWIDLNFPSIKVVHSSSNKIIHQILKNVTTIYLGVSENILFVELKNENEVISFVPNLELISSLPHRALLITSKSIKYDFVSRYFAPSVGINEDPVCGSAHCRLIPYWSTKLKKNKMIAYQVSKRGGIIQCTNLGHRLIISGQAITQ